MSNRNRIISDLFTSKEFNDCIKKMHPVELQDDLKAEVALILCEHSDTLIETIHATGGLKFYTVRIILNLIKSNTSPFYKKYRQPLCELTDNTQSIAYVDEDIDERIINELKEENVLSIIDNMYWYDREMLKLYMEKGNYREMQNATQIPWGSCYDAIQMAIAKIHYELRKQNKQIK